MQTVAGPWLVSLPTLVTGALFALVSLAAAEAGLIAGSPLPLPAMLNRAVLVAAAFLCGAILGMIRERSLSIWPAWGLLLGGCVLRLLVGVWFAS